MDRRREISRIIHVFQQSGFISNNPGRCSLLLEIEIDQLLRESFQLSQVGGTVHNPLETLLFKLLVEGNFHPWGKQLRRL